MANRLECSACFRGRKPKCQIVKDPSSHSIGMLVDGFCRCVSLTAPAMALLPPQTAPVA